MERTTKALHWGIKRAERDDSGIKWTLYSATLSDAEITRDFSINFKGYEIYNGPGRLFQLEPENRRTKSRVLMTQFFGYDI